MKFKWSALLCMSISAVFFYVSQPAHASLENYCAKKRGKIFSSYKCPKTKITLPIKTCEYKNFWGQRHFVNGCSGPTGKYSKQLFGACIKHDLCYHHEPATHGLNRKECDDQFLGDARRECRALKGEAEESCRRVASVLHKALRVIGGPAFQCENIAARY